MFNNSGFNLTPFNREYSTNVYGTFTMDSNLDMFASANLVISADFEVNHELSMLYEAYVEKLANFLIEHTNEMATNATRERIGSFAANSKLEMKFNAGRYHVDIIEFDGIFAPGDQIIIDSKHLTFTKNGQNSMHEMIGDFFDLSLGDNEITYTDDQTGRTVRMRITHRDKFV